MRKYPKIDLFYGGEYICSTHQSKTCKEAKQEILRDAPREAYYLSKISDLTKDKAIERKVHLFLSLAAFPEKLKARFAK